MGNTGRRIGIAAVAAFAAVPAVAGAHEGAQAYGGHHGMMWDGFGGWFMGPAIMLLFLVLAVVAVAAVVRWAGGHAPHQQAPSDNRNAAREILEQRFARGEIDEEEFRRRRQALDEST